VLPQVGYSCGAFFDGETTNIFRHLAAHVAARKCRNRMQARHNITRELDGPYLLTTMGGIQDALGDIATHAVAHPFPVVPLAPVVNFCLLNPSYTVEHLRTSGAQFAASSPGPAKTIVTTIITSLFRQAVTMKGEALRTYVWSLVFLFPSIVLGPHQSGAPSSAVKAETEARLDLWRRGQLPEVARSAVAAIQARKLGLPAEQLPSSGTINSQGHHGCLKVKELRTPHKTP